MFGIEAILCYVHVTVAIYQIFALLCNKKYYFTLFDLLFFSRTQTWSNLCLCVCDGDKKSQFWVYAHEEDGKYKIILPDMEKKFSICGKRESSKF